VLDDQPENKRRLLRVLGSSTTPHNPVNLAVDAQARFVNTAYSPGSNLDHDAEDLLISPGTTGCGSRDTGTRSPTSIWMRMGDECQGTMRPMRELAATAARIKLAYAAMAAADPTIYEFSTHVDTQ
jgi:hypothetical protein